MSAVFFPRGFVSIQKKLTVVFCRTIDFSENFVYFQNLIEIDYCSIFVRVLDFLFSGFSIIFWVFFRNRIVQIFCAEFRYFWNPSNRELYVFPYFPCFIVFSQKYTKHYTNLKILWKGLILLCMLETQLCWIMNSLLPYWMPGYT